MGQKPGALHDMDFSFLICKMKIVVIPTHNTFKAFVLMSLT